jgi:hypothetical protein
VAPLGVISTSAKARGPFTFLAGALSSAVVSGVAAGWCLRLCAQTEQTLRKMTPNKRIRYNVAEAEGETAMDINDKAPAFTLPDQNGKELSLKDFRDKYVVLFFIREPIRRDAPSRLASFGMPTRRSKRPAL